MIITPLLALAEPSGLISILIWLLILCVVIYLFFWVLGKIPLPEPIRTIITVVVALALLLFLVQRLGFI